MPPSPLPIDVVVPDALSALSSTNRLVLEAPPGAGKTTRLPWAVANADFCRGRVIVTEPRRIAASLAARRVADEQDVKRAIAQMTSASPGTRISMTDAISTVVMERLGVSDAFAVDPEFMADGA